MCRKTRRWRSWQKSSRFLSRESFRIAFAKSGTSQTRSLDWWMSGQMNAVLRTSWCYGYRTKWREGGYHVPRGASLGCLVVVISTTRRLFERYRPGRACLSQYNDCLGVWRVMATLCSLDLPLTVGFVDPDSASPPLIAITW